MDFNFTGSSRVPRSINLGGVAASGRSAAELAATARAERAARDLKRRSIVAAAKIQAFVRGRNQSNRVKQEWAEEFDSYLPSLRGANLSPSELVRATRLLAFSKDRHARKDQERLRMWIECMTRGAPASALMEPFASDYQLTWQSLVQSLCRRAMLYLSGSPDQPDSEQALAYLNFLSVLTSNAGHNSSIHWLEPATGQDTALLREAVARFLIENGLYKAINLHLCSFPVDRRASPTLGPAVSLVLSILTISPAAGLPETSLSLSDFVQDILTIPALPSRLPIATLTSLVTSLPFDEVVAQLKNLNQRPTGIPGASGLPESSPLRSRYLLANFLSLGSSRVKHMKTSKEIKDYLEVLAILQDALPPAAFIEPRQAESRSLPPPAQLDAMQYDQDVDVVQQSDLSAIRREGQSLATESQVYKQLSSLVSETHIVALLSASARFSSTTRPALCSFFCAVLSAWPAVVRERVFSMVMYGLAQTSKAGAASGLGSQSAGGLIREVWRGWVRGSALSRTLGRAGPGTSSRDTLAVFTDERYAAEWPPLVLLCELYSRSLLTMGDDEFYPAADNVGPSTGSSPSKRTSASRNPLTLDELVDLSGTLRNLAFAMYWHEGSGVLSDLHSYRLAHPSAPQVAAPLSRGTLEASSKPSPRVPGMRLRLSSLRTLLTKLLQQLHVRDSRRPFAPEGHWLMLRANEMTNFVESVVVEEQELASGEHEEAEEEDEDSMDVDEQPTAAVSRGASRSQTTRGPPAIDADDDEYDDDEPLPQAARRPAPVKSRVLTDRSLAFLSPRLGVLNHIPFVIPFEVRVEIFRQFVRNDAQRLNLHVRDFHYSGFRRQRVTVRRGHIAQDGFDKLNVLRGELKRPIEIVFFDQFGQEEAGIDGGGVFKEFLNELVKEVFDTDRGLWSSTDSNEIYPNPLSYAREKTQLEWFEFLGRVLGKALYEGILVDIKFAGFFLSKWLGRQTYLDDLASLHGLDAEMYRGLIFLKNYEGNVETDLALNFTVSDEEFGEQKVTPLIPGGENIAVTNENRLAYIYRVSHYRLTTQIAAQCQAFFSGLSEMVDPRWLRMLNREELRVLVSGADTPVNVSDLRANTVYGGYHEADEPVTWLWEVLEGFSDDERRAFLRFVTSCPQPPLLGFGQLQPKFAIRDAGGDDMRLPTASTCVNLLKMPRYKTKEQLESKLRYAIEAKAGFDLS